MQKLVIKKPSISLKDGEVCFYQKRASAYNVKNVVVGRKSGSAGVTMRLAKGVSIHTGNSASENIRQNVGEHFEGTLYITNMRIVLLAPKYGFDVSIPKISSLSQRKDGFQVYSGAKCHNVLTSDVKQIIKILNLMNQAQTDENNTHSEEPSKKSTVMSAAKEIVELKNC